jgi:hypothetical protein
MAAGSGHRLTSQLNRVQSSRRLDREASRNVEVMWLLGRLAPDHKTISDFPKDNGPAIKKVCAQFVKLCRLCCAYRKLKTAVGDVGRACLEGRYGSGIVLQMCVLSARYCTQIL